MASYTDSVPSDLSTAEECEILNAFTLQLAKYSKADDVCLDAPLLQKQYALLTFL
jgi:hypothetical protein